VDTILPSDHETDRLARRTLLAFVLTFVGAQWELPGALARRNDRKKAVGEVLHFVE
jgi:hypothetical protein